MTLSLPKHSVPCAGVVTVLAFLVIFTADLSAREAFFKIHGPPTPVPSHGPSPSPAPSAAPSAAPTSCVFPFKYRQADGTVSTHTSCTTKQVSGGDDAKAWCATSVDKDGFYVEQDQAADHTGRWIYCDDAYERSLLCVKDCTNPKDFGVRGLTWPPNHESIRKHEDVGVTTASFCSWAEASLKDGCTADCPDVIKQGLQSLASSCKGSATVSATFGKSAKGGACGIWEGWCASGMSCSSFWSGHCLPAPRQDGDPCGPLTGCAEKLYCAASASSIFSYSRHKVTLDQGTCHTTDDSFNDNEGNLHIYKYDDFGAHETNGNAIQKVTAGKKITFEYRNRGGLLTNRLPVLPTHQVFLVGSCPTNNTANCQAKIDYDECKVEGENGERTKDFNQLPQTFYKPIPSGGGHAFQYIGGAEKVAGVIFNQYPPWSKEVMPTPLEGEEGHGWNGITTYQVPLDLKGQTLFFICGIVNTGAGGCSGGIRRVVNVV